MDCKYCNSNMNFESELDISEIKVYKCKCGASCIRDVKSSTMLWNDGKPPRVECIKDNMTFKKGETYRIVDADTCQVKVKTNNGDEWIDKDDSRFNIFM